MVSRPQTHIIIVAAGTGNRFGSNLPKQFHMLGPRPVLMHTIDAFRGLGPITLVISPAMRTFWDDLCRRHAFASPRTVDGGATRYESVRNALTSLRFGADDIVLVHDGARPLVTADVITRVIDTLARADAVVPVAHVTDTLRLVQTDGTSHTVDRSTFRAVQTPQGFRAPLLARAYEMPFNPSFTDDASVVEAAGTAVTLVDGDPANIKITSPRDIAVARALLLPDPS